MSKRGRPAKATAKKPVQIDSTKPVEPPKEAALTVDAVAAHFSENMPAVESYVLDASPSTPVEKQEPETPETPEGPEGPKKPIIGPIGTIDAIGKYDYKDRYKRPFSPALHETNADGSPKLTRNGNISIRAIKTPGAERLQAHAIGAKPPEVQLAEKEQAIAKLEAKKKAETEAASLIQTKNCAFMTVMAFTGVAQGIFSDEWKAEEAEADMLVEATTQYFHSQGITDITPGWALLLAVGGYALPRLMMPKTKAKIEGAINAVMGPPPNKQPKLHLVPDAPQKPIPPRAEFEAAQAAMQEPETATAEEPSVLNTPTEWLGA